MKKNKYSVLCIDDSEFMLLMLQDILKNSEFEIVATAGTREAALKAFNQYLPDIVTIDIGLPKISGLDVLEEIQKVIKDRKIETKCLMVSAANKDKNLQEASQKGAAGFIIKPFKPETLLKQLRKAVS